MKRTFLPLTFLLAATAAFAAGPVYETMSIVQDRDAVVSIDGRPEAVLFEPGSLLITVRLQRGTGDSTLAYPGDWTRGVRFSLSRTDGAPAALRDAGALVVHQDLEQIHADEKLVDHWVSAQFKLRTLPKGTYRLQVIYGDLPPKTIERITVVHGDETAEIRDWALQRELEKAKSWDDVKRIQLARVANAPRNLSAWFGLAAGAEQNSSYEETRGYYERAMTVARELGGFQSAETVKGIEKTLDLLPAYFADREHLVIVRENVMGPGTPTRIELRQRNMDRGETARKK